VGTEDKETIFKCGSFIEALVLVSCDGVESGFGSYLSEIC